jgi:UDP-glucose 4-epimerase
MTAMNNDPVLIVGGNGFIGSHLVDRLIQSREVVVLDRRARRYDDFPDRAMLIKGESSDVRTVREALRANGIKTVFYFAWTSIGETATKDPGRDVLDNVLPFLRFLDACVAERVDRVIFTSSGGTVYGLPTVRRVAETHQTSPINAYGVAKLACEKYLQMYSVLYGIEYVILRPSVPYGPRQDLTRRQGAISIFTQAALRREPITVLGDGSSLRDYFYIDDLIEGIVCAASGPANTIFNLAGSHGYTLREVIKTIEDVLNLRVEARYEPARKIDVPVLLLDCDRAATFLGWHPQILLRSGIERTANWLEKLN